MSGTRFRGIGRRGRRLRAVGPSGRSRMIRATGIVAVMAASVVACGDAEDASLCTAYDGFLDIRAEVADTDPTSETAAAAIEVGEEYLARVHRLQHAADGRYGQQLDGLEELVENILRTLAAIPDDADYATWSPLIEDDYEAASDAADQVERLLAASCEVDIAATSKNSGT